MYIQPTGTTQHTKAPEKQHKRAAIASGKQVISISRADKKQLKRWTKAGTQCKDIIAVKCCECSPHYPDLPQTSLFACHRFQKSEYPVLNEATPVIAQAKHVQWEEKPVYIGHDLHIRPNCIIAIPAFTGNIKRGGNTSSRSLANLQDNKVKGELSKASKQKLNNSLNWMVAAAKRHRVWSKQYKKHYSFKCAMITLTLPSAQGKVSDSHVKKVMLGKFIDWMRKTKAVKNYVWKAEPQKNGNIHIHMVINQFIHYNDVRREWLKICQEERLVEKEQYQKSLQAVPCTEVKAIRNVKKLGAYICSYFSKKHEGRREIKGRLWACNYELSSKNKVVVRADAFDTESLVQWWSDKRIVTKALEVKGKIEGQSRKIGEIAILKAQHWKDVVCEELRELYYTHLWNIRHNVQSLPLSYYQF